MLKPGLVGQTDAAVDPQRRQQTPREGPNAEKRRPVDQNRAYGRRWAARTPQGGKVEIR